MAFSRLGALELDGSAQGYDPRLFITYSPPFYNILRVTCVPSLSLGVQFCRSGNHAAAPVLVCWSGRGVLLLGRALSARLAGCGVCSPDVSDRCPHPSGRFRGSSIRAGQVWRRLRHDDATSAWHIEAIPSEIVNHIDRRHSTIDRHAEAEVYVFTGDHGSRSVEGRGRVHAIRPVPDAVEVWRAVRGGIVLIDAWPVEPEVCACEWHATENRCHRARMHSIPGCALLEARRADVVNYRRLIFGA